jgi:hypothetical protein
MAGRMQAAFASLDVRDFSASVRCSRSRACSSTLEPREFSTVSCGTGIIIVRIMNWWNYL